MEPRVILDFFPYSGEEVMRGNKIGDTDFGARARREKSGEIKRGWRIAGKGERDATRSVPECQ